MSENLVLSNQLASPSLSNLLVNGGFEIWQRGAGAFTANNAYTSDRWQNLLGGTSTTSITQETTIVTSGSAASLKAVYVQGTVNSQIDQKLEDFKQLQGQTVSFSVRVRQGVTSNIRPYISDSGSKTFGVASATTGSFVTLTVTLTIGAAATAVNVGVDAGTSDTFYLDNAMLVVGATPVAYVPLTPAEEWNRCQRYYEVAVDTTVGSPVIFVSQAAATTQVFFPWLFKTRKAVAPTVTVVNPTTGWVAYNAAVNSSSAFQTVNSIGSPNQQGVYFNVTLAGAILVAGNASVVQQATGGQITAEANP